MRKLTACFFVLLLTEVSVAQTVESKKAYVCAETEAVGFRSDQKTGVMKSGSFKGERFTMIFDGATAVVKDSGTGKETRYTCQQPWTYVAPKMYQCAFGFTVLAFDANFERFTLAHMYSFVNGSQDTLTIGYGTCQKF